MLDTAVRGWTQVFRDSFGDALGAGDIDAVTAKFQAYW